MRTAVLVVALTALVSFGLPASATRAAGGPSTTSVFAEPERWSGEISAPGAKLGFILHLTRADSGLTGKMAIPQQGLTDPVDLKELALDGKTLTFTFGVPPMPPSAYAKFSVLIDNDAGTATGTMTQGGQKMPVTMKRLAAGEEAPSRKRPQEPKPPFPYTQREVEVTSPDGAKLPGTLTIPEESKFGKGPFPAVSLVTGSGTQDRDEALMGHKPFMVLADALTRRGIVVLRVDDRGWGGHTDPAHGEGTTDTFVYDAIACIVFLKKQPEADASRVGLVGHSEGGLIAPMAAAKSSDVAFIVLLAGTGVNGREVLDAQSAAIMKAEGAPADDEKALAARKKVMDLAADPAKTAEFEAALTELVRIQLAAGGKEPEPELIQQAVIQGKRQLASKWMQRFMTLDPREALRKTRCPVLALNGSLDMQVIATQNLPPIAAALMEAGNPDVTIRVMPGLNHLFQHARTGSVSEYETIEETMSPEVLRIVADWILERKAATQPSK
ncbi:MAG: alpha/beta hydrolase family protein [Phycisphaerales bacterium]